MAESGRSLIQKLSLKKRTFIGNTSMDPQLSLLMANLGQVCNGDLVLDPFVGSGSSNLHFSLIINLLEYIVLNFH